MLFCLRRPFPENPQSHSQHGNSTQTNFSEQGVKLGKEQWQKLKNATSSGYGDFDVTLLYTMIRNHSLRRVIAPSNGWGKSPTSASQSTIGDDVERIRELRNGVYGHAVSTEIPDHVFRGYWKIVQDICSRMDSRYGGTMFSDKLKEIDKVDFVPKIVSDYNDIVNRQLQKDDVLQRELRGIKGK